MSRSADRRPRPNLSYQTLEVWRLLGRAQLETRLACESLDGGQLAVAFRHTADAVADFQLLAEEFEWILEAVR